MTISEILAESEQICQENGVTHLYLYGSFATLRKIDVIDYDACRNSFLKEDIEKYGRQVY